MNINELTTDFVILGAGVRGSSIAFQLAKRGGRHAVSTSRFAEGNLIRPQFEYAENQAKETA